jgi:hypothetical protein
VTPAENIRDSLKARQKELLERRRDDDKGACDE